ARALRQRQTPAEALARDCLRDRRCLGFKFRRQHVIRGFIVDFYCPELRLVIEVDGPIHLRHDIACRDRYRTHVIGRLGITVLRLRKDEISAECLAELVGAIRAARRSPRPAPGTRPTCPPSPSRTPARPG
ncbi:MAG: DUF559 domain-containing protein, partial [Gemmatimonadales bacterium]|nr:DUF559 domain-containing protein [Gemmatimonadales bacterium]